MKGRWLFLLLLIAPFGLALFFWDVTSRILINQDQSPVDMLATGAPQTIVEDTELVQFNINGEPAHQLQSNKLLSDEVDGLIYIAEPVIGIDPEDQNNWSARSEQGIYDQQAKTVEMRGNVQLTKTHPAEAPITISTEELHYYPNRNFAESDTPVIIETAGHRIQTSGISVDFENSIYKLKANVRGVHEPL